MAGAAGRAAGNADFGQGTVRNVSLPHGLHSALQNGLAVPHALLADGSADAGNAGLKQRFGTICGGIQHSGSFVCRQVDDVQRFIGGNAAFAAGDGAEQVVQLHQFFRDQAAANGVVRHSVQPRLFLGNGARVIQRAGAGFGNGGGGQVQFQAFVRLGSGNVLQKDAAQLIRAKGLLHKAGAQSQLPTPAPGKAFGGT